MENNYAVIYGFDKYGYTVQVLKNGSIVDEYDAGNCPGDSVAVIENGLPLKTIRKYARITASEYAAEYNCKFSECSDLSQQRKDLMEMV